MPNQTANSKPLATIRAVVFDLDGLMVNTEEVFHLAGHELIRRRGKEMTPQAFARMMGRRAHEAFANLVDELQLSEPIQDLIDESGEIFNSLLDDILAPMPGLFDLLERIDRAGLPKAVATSSSRSYLENILGRFDLLPRFDTTLTAEDVTHGKPHPEIYLTAAKKIGVTPGEMLVLEDSSTGTQAAAAAGAVIVSVPHRHSATHDFTVATHIAESLIDPYVLRLIDAAEPARRDRNSESRRNAPPKTQTDSLLSE